MPKLELNLIQIWNTKSETRTHFSTHPYWITVEHFYCRCSALFNSICDEKKEIQVIGGENLSMEANNQCLLCTEKNNKSSEIYKQLFNITSKYQGKKCKTPHEGEGDLTILRYVTIDSCWFFFSLISLFQLMHITM